MIKRGILCLVLLCLASCSGKKAPAPEPVGRLGDYRFDYEISPVGQKLLSQVFDDCIKTYVQLRPGIGRETISIRGKGGERLKTVSSGQVIEVAGVHESVIVSIGKTSSTALNRHGACVPKPKSSQVATYLN